LKADFALPLLAAARVAPSIPTAALSGHPAVAKRPACLIAGKVRSGKKKRTTSDLQQYAIAWTNDNPENAG
jgi:hypothetical protein